MGESVEFHIGMAHAVSNSLPMAGKAVDTPVDVDVQPGRGLSLVVGMVVASLKPDIYRSTQGTTNLTPNGLYEEITRRLRLQARSQAQALVLFLILALSKTKQSSICLQIPCTWRRPCGVLFSRKLRNMCR